MKNSFCLVFAVAMLVSNVCQAKVAAQAKEILVRSICPKTSTVGYGRGPTFSIARERAVADCLDKGGRSDCCPAFVKQMN